MPFLDPLDVRLLNQRGTFPWLTLAERRWEDPETGEIHTIPKYFRTDGSSVPEAIIAVPLIGQGLAMRFLENGMWLGFDEGVLHDYLRRPDKITMLPPIPAKMAHIKFRRALYERYPDMPDLCEYYYSAVVAFNSK